MTTAPSGVTAEQSDLRNSEKFATWYGQDLRYVAAWKKWLVWDGARFKVDECGAALEAAKSTVRRMLAEVSMGDESALKWATKSQSLKSINSIECLARSIRGIATQTSELDQDPMILNVKNGTIDLKTGRFRAHNRADMLTKVANVTYDPSAKCDEWIAFLNKVFANNQDIIAFIKRFLGYCLTGLNVEQVLLFLHGRGRNGKSTFRDFLQGLLGDYATSAPRTLLFSAKNEQHPTELASLQGARFVLCSEVQDGYSIDEAKVKDITGEKMLKARKIGQDFYMFAQTHKLILSGNHKPRIESTDDGIWRRILQVPFKVQIKKKEVDLLLLDKLLAEASKSGALNWFIEGCLEWQKEGLNPPKEVVDATKEYREESDTFGEFLRLHCLFGVDERSTRAELRTSYEEYCSENGVKHRLDAKAFAKRLKEENCTGISVKRNGKVFNGWAGVRLLTDDERDRSSEESIAAPVRAQEPDEPNEQPITEMPSAQEALEGAVVSNTEPAPVQALTADQEARLDRLIETYQSEGLSLEEAWGKASEQVRNSG